jgi:steroid delta-isomerase-like uncharacterized protein
MDSFDELVHPDYTDGFDGSGRDEYRALIGAMQAAFPDLRVTIEDEIAEGVKVVGRFVLRGTHHGEFLGIAATGKQVEFDGVGIIELRDGKMIRRWNVSDAHGLLEQLREG